MMLMMCWMSSLLKLRGADSDGVLKTDRLTLGRMMNLEEWETNTMGGSEILTCLDELKIRKCPKLVQLPIIPSVICLTIKDCTVTLMRSVVNFYDLP
jgi:hypothetical protein